ncbi:MAG: Ig domain-containing protein [Candidatus Micrarchaeota archaeon]|nr:Ig domain-containing protein [Candidatus Micrarchaeota archaeon]
MKGALFACLLLLMAASFSYVIPEEEPILEDVTPPSLSTSVSVNGNVYTLSASASDPSGIASIKLYLRKSTQAQFQLVKSCSSSPCIYTSGDSDGTYIFYATATDASPNSNQAISPEKTFVLSGDTTPPQVSASATVSGNVVTITAFASDPSGISSIKIYVAKGMLGGHDPFIEVKSCSSSPCQHISGYNSGSYVYYAKATDASPNQNSASTAYSTFTVASATTPPNVIDANLPVATVGKSYSGEITASGGDPPYSWSIVEGALPPGLFLSSGANKAQITGTPTKAGLYTFGIRATDSLGQISTTRIFQISVIDSVSWSCTISPSSLSLSAGSTQKLSITCYRKSQTTGKTDEDECPPISWQSTIGTISGNSRGATFSAGSSGGSGTITASGNGFSCSVPVSVSSGTGGGGSGGGGTGGGGGGGGGSGGGGFRTSIGVSATCVNNPVTINVRYLSNASGQPKATVDVYYYSQNKFSKVYTNTISSTSSLSFVPSEIGAYQIRVSLGSEQTTADFTIPACSQEVLQNPQNITLQLSPSKETILSKKVTYTGGFSKEFRVYRITVGSDVTYETQIDLYYVANESQNITVRDFIPNTIVSNMQQITFEQAPRKVDSAQAGILAFEWPLNAQKGQTVHFKYSFRRQITDQMVANIPAPVAIAATQGTQQVGLSLGGITDSVSAALVGAIGSNWWAIVLLLALVALAVIYMFVFGTKKEG